MISDIHPRRPEEAVERLKAETGLQAIYGQLCNVVVEEEVQAQSPLPSRLWAASMC